MFFFRVDSNQTISSGHIMRCIAIAKALIEHKEKVLFLIADSNPVPVLEETEIPYFILNSDWEDLFSDIDKVIEIIKKEENPVLLIDTYRVSKEYVEELKPYGKIVYLGSKPVYLGKLDLLINYSTNIDYIFYKKNYDRQTKLLLGPSYAPLRKEFQNVVPVFRNQVERILITTGNTDRNHVIFSLIDCMIPVIAKTQIKLEVIVGRMFENKEMLYAAYNNNSAVVFHENVKSMSSLMKECDLAISANGTTVYELSAVGLPIISFVIAEEQVKSAEALSALGVVDYCGKAYENKKACAQRIAARVSYYLKNNDKRIQLAEKAHELIDGNGVGFITEELVSLQNADSGQKELR